MLTTVFDFELILPGTFNILVASKACLSAPNSFNCLYKYSSIAFHNCNA